MSAIVRRPQKQYTAPKEGDVQNQRENHTVLEVNMKKNIAFFLQFQCVFTPGLGFTRGAYRCQCLKGFYNRGNIDQFFEGMDVEAHYANNTDGDEEFQCRQCAPGCESCVDNSPCLFETNLILRVMLLLLTVFTLMGIAVTSFLTYYYRHAKVGYSKKWKLWRYICHIITYLPGFVGLKEVMWRHYWESFIHAYIDAKYIYMVT